MKTFGWTNHWEVISGNFDHITLYKSFDGVALTYVLEPSFRLCTLQCYFANGTLMEDNVSRFVLLWKPIMTLSYVICCIYITLLSRQPCCICSYCLVILFMNNCTNWKQRHTVRTLRGVLIMIIIRPQQCILYQLLFSPTF